MEQVPYRGSSQALLDLSVGRVHFMIDAMTSATPQVRGGRIKALAVLAQNRSPILPNVPNMRDSGVPEVVDFQSLAWAGLMAPAGTPQAVTLYWNRTMSELLADPNFVRRLAQQNVEAAPPGGPERLADILRTDLARWQRLVRDANIVI